MSFSSSSRRSGSAGKGAAAKKKTTRKKQEFHTTKKRGRQPEKVDLQKLKERTITGLEHLGHQKFSSDRGSYGMEGWVKSLTLLLDDFESGLSPLPDGYAEKREEVVKQLSTPVDTSKLEAKMEAIRSEEVAIRTKMENEKERIVSRLAAIKTQNERQNKELEVEKAALVKLKSERESASFFSKLMGRGGPPTKPTEAKIEELRSALKALDDEEAGLVKARESMEKRDTDSPDPYAADWRRLNEVAAELDQLEGELQETLQRAKERADAADLLVKLVQDVELPKAETPGE